MNKKRMMIIRVVAVLILVAIGWWMTIIGRGHTVYLDAKKIEVNGTEYKPAYKTEVYVKGERVAKLYDKERGMSTCIGKNFTMTLKITQEKGGDTTEATYTLALPQNMDGVIINLPAYLAGLPEEVYMSEFIPAPETEEETEETSAEDDFGMEGMDLGEDMTVEG